MGVAHEGKPPLSIAIALKYASVGCLVRVPYFDGEQMNEHTYSPQEVREALDKQQEASGCQ